MSRLLGIGSSKAGVYKKIKQTPSDEEIESSEEYTMFDKNDRSTIELQLMPSITEKRKRPIEDFDIKGKGNNCYLCLLLLGIVVVALSGLAIGVVLVRTLQLPPETRKNTTDNSFHKSNSEPVHENDIPKSEGTIKWKKRWDDVDCETAEIVYKYYIPFWATVKTISTKVLTVLTVAHKAGESCIRLLDIDGDGKDDILFGAANGKDMNNVLKLSSSSYNEAKKFCQTIGKSFPCMGYIIAVRGYDGHLLWNLTVRSEIFLINCEDFDINKDGKPDCIGTGRQGTAVAFNPFTGVLYWSVDDDIFFKGNWNIYQAIALPDWDGDGIPEVLLANGGDPSKAPTDHNRESGRLVVVSGSTGQPVGRTYLEMPNSRETYMSPLLYQPPRGSSIILFGSGGETVSGDLMGISLIDMCHYIFGSETAQNRCPEKERETFWPDLKKDENGVFIIIRGHEKGVMVPPVLVDVNGDTVNDILVSIYDGRLVLKNGKDLTDMWTASFPNMESYSTPAPGYFDDDDVLDFMVHWCVGAWPDYTSSNVSVISGKDGTILWTLESSHYQMTSDLVLQTSESHRDLFVFKQKALQSQYRIAADGRIIRPNDKMRQKRHGEEVKKPHKVHIPDNGSIADALKADYAEDHFTCEDDISRNGGEMFIVDRTSMQNPLKILDIPVIKYWYDVPVTENGQHEKLDKVPPLHRDVRSVNNDKATKTERRCTLLDSDDRSTGAIGDIDGDGVLDFISVFGAQGQILDSGYSYEGMKYTLHVNVVSLDLSSDDFKQIQVPSKSSFRARQNLRDIRTLHILPLSEQKWTEYLGKHGDSKNG